MIRRAHASPLEPRPLRIQKSSGQEFLWMLPGTDTPADLLLDRELSLVAFHRRVLSRARRDDVPLLERLRFLAISSAILDEFFEIRVGGLKEQIALGITEIGPDGRNPVLSLAEIRRSALELVELQYRTLSEQILPALAEQGIHVLRRDAWSDPVSAWSERYFRDQVLPVLTPFGLDPAHPFPPVLNKSLNFILELSGQDAFGRSSRAAVVQAPRVLPRLIPIPEEICGKRHQFVLLSSVIHAHVHLLFPGMSVTACDQFRLTRNSDLWIDEEEVDDFLRALKGELPRRGYGDVVRLEVSETCSPERAAFLLDEFGLGPQDLYRVDGPVNLHRLETLYDLVDRPDLKDPSFVPAVPRRLAYSEDLFAVIRDKDLLLHHPYESYQPVLGLLRQAARDPDVLSIKLTVYRTDAGSGLGSALLEAARNGKEVTAVIELRARFDEAHNIELATQLQDAGARVAYGIVGYKAHAKMMLVVRREAGQLRRYVHLGTGNYNARTARSYTDFGLLTRDPAIGEDVHNLFQQLTGLGRAERMQKLVQAPFDLHRWLIERIDEQAERARQGRPARIRAKVNSLIDPVVIHALYRASSAGVPIDLLVRSVCCLRPGVKGVSESIRVRSVVGRFLEHHRIVEFATDGEPVVYLSSADWMPRNFFRRLEIAFPVEDPELRTRVIAEGVDVHWEPNDLAFDMAEDGDWRPAQGATPNRGSHAMLLERLSPRTVGEVREEPAGA